MFAWHALLGCFYKTQAVPDASGYRTPAEDLPTGSLPAGYARSLHTFASLRKAEKTTLNAVGVRYSKIFDHLFGLSEVMCKPENSSFLESWANHPHEYGK